MVCAGCRGSLPLCHKYIITYKYRYQIIKSSTPTFACLVLFAARRLKSILTRKYFEDFKKKRDNYEISFYKSKTGSL